MSRSASSSSSHAPVRDVEEQRAARVRRVGDVHSAAGQVPDEPGVDRAERELAALGALARAGHVVEQPLELRAREIGVDDEAGLRGEQSGVASRAQRVAQRRGAAILPDDRVGDRLAGRAIPQHRGLALIGDADRRDARAASTPAFASASCRTPDCVAQISIASCSTQPGCGKICRNSCCATARTVPAWSNTQRARAGRALVEGEDERHGCGIGDVRPAASSVAAPGCAGLECTLRATPAKRAPSL